MLKDEHQRQGHHNWVGDLWRRCVRLSKAGPSLVSVLLLAVMTSVIAACDPEGKRECAWVLEADMDRFKQQSTTDKRSTRVPLHPGFIPVCARNRVTMKQDCRLQTTLAYAKKHSGKTFRYVDLKVVDYGLPRTIRSITFCRP